MTDSSPTFSSISVTPKKLTAWLTGSYEIVMDSQIVAQLPELIQEAFDVTEGAAWIGGNGTTQPLGVVTAVSATAGSTVTATTRGASAFTSASVADLYAVDNALPARARNGKPAWIANRKQLNIIRSMSAAAAGSSFWASLGDGTPPRLLDSSIYECSDMNSVTTTGSINLVLGDFSRYFCIVDRIGTVIEPVQNVVSSDGVPTGTRGFLAWKRTGSTVTSVDGFRFLLA